jgi:hypothetical protein
VFTAACTCPQYAYANRTVWRLCIKRHVTQARLQVSDDGQTVLVSADWPMKSRDASFWRKIFGGNTEYGWKPSQHVFISIPEMGRKSRFQYHPFTIASAAPAPGQTCGWFNLIIRAKGGFSRDLLHYAEKTHRRGSVSMDPMALYAHWRWPVITTCASS